jgi:hypothetical protein
MMRRPLPSLASFILFAMTSPSSRGVQGKAEMIVAENGYGPNERCEVNLERIKRDELSFGVGNTM